MQTDGHDSDEIALSGAFAGFVSTSLLYPAETLSTRYQAGGTGVLKSLIRYEGPAALWGGLGAGLMGSIPSTAIYFMCCKFSMCQTELIFLAQMTHSNVMVSATQP